MKGKEGNPMHIKSISEVYALLGYGQPLHPLIAIIREFPEMDISQTKLTGDLFLIGLKGGMNGAFKYGRNSYDFEAGTLTFLAPNQAIQFDQTYDKPENDDSWTIFFHPDLFLRTEFHHKLKDYSFFDYDIHEGLHLSDKEKQKLEVLVDHIDAELQQNIDKHSQHLIVSNLETLLAYCLRYYERQFYTRTNLNQGIVSRFMQYLQQQFEVEKEIPSVAACAEELSMSANYLSDLLRIETGKSAKDHIHDYIIEKAKNLLLASTHNVSEVAYHLGFDYPQHFSRLFKSKTGMSPSEFRNVN
ncbi:MAG: helix-turn-helix transcriptional regulator [Bacteroidota bacterium]